MILPLFLIQLGYQEVATTSGRRDEEMKILIFMTTTSSNRSLTGVMQKRDGELFG
jgi:hypothetical protein